MQKDVAPRFDLQAGCSEQGIDGFSDGGAESLGSIFGTDLTPSRICLGTGPFGSEISKAESFAVLDEYVAAGGNFLDTAHIYAAWLPGGWGASERTIGEWLQAHGARKAILLGTKGGHPPLDRMAEARCSQAALTQDLRESLGRLEVDVIDVYWLHRDDPNTPVGEIIEHMDSFVREGRIRSYGLSNWTLPRIEAAIAYAIEHDLPRPVAAQPGWALADRTTDETAASPMRYLDEPARQWHVRNAFPLVAYSSQANGYFGEANAAWAQREFNGPPPKGRSYDSTVNRRRLLAAIDLAGAKGCTPNQIALAYLLRQPFPVFPIVGTRHPERAREACAAVTVKLADADWAILRAGMPL